MQANLKALQQDAHKLQQGLEAVARQMDAYEQNIIGINQCADELRQKLRIVGNNKVAAISHKERARIMDELEALADNLLALLDDRRTAP